MARPAAITHNQHTMERDAGETRAEAGVKRLYPSERRDDKCRSERSGALRPAIARNRSFQQRKNTAAIELEQARAHWQQRSGDEHQRRARKSRAGPARPRWIPGHGACQNRAAASRRSRRWSPATRKMPTQCTTSRIGYTQVDSRSRDADEGVCWSYTGGNAKHAEPA